jgi:hypothetical protein
VTVRSNRYLNNIVEQDHRAIKRRCAAMLGIKSFKTAEIALAGIELAHRIRKGQFALAIRRVAGHVHSSSSGISPSRQATVMRVRVFLRTPSRALLHQNSRPVAQGCA